MEMVDLEANKGIQGAGAPGYFAVYATACLLFPASFQVGTIFNYWHLPIISGYLVTGVLCGPHMLAVLSPDANDQLWLAQDVCLAIIALAAGSQLRWAEFVENMHTVLCLCAGVFICTWLAMVMAMLMVSEQVDFLMHLSENAHLSTSVISATVMVARSPASAIAVMRELDAKGRFSTVVLTVAISIDIVVIVLFSVVSEFGSSVHHGKTFNPLMSAMVPLGHLCLALVVGILLGQGLVQMLIALKPQRKRYKASAVLVVATAAYYSVQELLHSEPLLVCVMAGVTATNHRVIERALHGWFGRWFGWARGELSKPGDEKRSKSKLTPPTSAEDLPLVGNVADELPPTPGSPAMPSLPTSHSPENLPDSEIESLRHVVGLLLPLINVAFFTLSGSALDINALSTTLTATMFLFTTRIMALFTGASVGSYLAGWPANHVRICWMAGVSIGLAKEVGLTFPDWGDSLCNLLVSVIVLNQIIGPPLFKIALIQAGDANPDKLPTVQRQPRQHKLSAFVPRGITPVELSQLS